MATKSERYGESILKWQPHPEGGFAGVVVRDGKATKPFHDDDEARLLARLQNEAGRLHPDYVGFDGAMGRFKAFFEGFAAAAKERDHKVEAARRLRSTISIEQACDATGADALEVGDAKIYTELLAPPESARLRDTLAGQTGATYLQGAAAFAMGEYQTGCAQMTAAVAPHGRISWPLLTYLPFLWDTDRHMFLKPEVTRDFADRVGHPFSHVYSPEPNPETYLSLLDLVEGTSTAIRSLEPRDNIDIQIFIWVVGKYRADDRPQ